MRIFNPETGSKFKVGEVYVVKNVEVRVNMQIGSYFAETYATSVFEDPDIDKRKDSKGIQHRK